MTARRFGTWILSVAAVVGTCVICERPARANDIVPWMTGDFYSGYDNFGINHVDGTNYFQLVFHPQIHGFSWHWYCEDERLCYGSAYGTITGTVTGELYSDWDTGHPTLDATFQGWITDGEAVGMATWDSFYESYWEWDRYEYSFRGLWTNGLATTGHAKTAWSTDMWYSGDYSLVTTTTPEPSSCTLAGLAILSIWSWIKRQYSKETR